MASVCRLLAYGAFLVYLAIGTVQMYDLFFPRVCRGRQCLRPLLPASGSVDLAVYVVSTASDDGADWREPVWSEAGVDLAAGDVDASFALPVPAAVRLGTQRHFYLLLELRKAGDAMLLATAQAELVRAYAPRAHSTAEYLLDPLFGGGGGGLSAEQPPSDGARVGGHGAEQSPSDGGRSHAAATHTTPARPPPPTSRGRRQGTTPTSRSEVAPMRVAASPTNHGVTAPNSLGRGVATYSDGRVAHYVYAGRRCEFRLVADATPHATPHLPEGLPIGSGVDLKVNRHS